MFCDHERVLGEGAKGFFVSGPYPLPQTPTLNPLSFDLVGEGGAKGPAFPHQT